MWALVLIAARNLAQHRRRTLLLGGAIAGVTLLLVILLALSDGIYVSMLESATTLITGHINVAGFFKVSAGQSAPVVTHYEKVEELVRQNVPEIDYIVDRGRGFAKLVSETGSITSGIAGINIDRERELRRTLKLIEGSLDGLHEPNSVLIFKGQADRLGVKVGDTVTLTGQTGRGTNNTIDLKVVAIAKDVGLLSAFSVLIPQQALRLFYQLRDDSTGAIFLYLKDMKDIPKVEDRLRKVLAGAGYTLMDKDPQVFWQKFQSVNREGWTGQRIDITNWEDESSFLKWTLRLVRVLSVALLTILLFIIGIGIMNTLWIAIRERTREIGTLRAIGMQRLRVMAMFLVEALVLALASTTAGSLLGALFCTAINLAKIDVPSAVQLFLMANVLRLSLAPLSVLMAIAFITLCAVLVSLVPSYLAARLKPITAMQRIG